MATDDKNRHDHWVVDGTLRYLGDEQLASLASATALTPATNSRVALIGVSGANVRFRVGAAPTATVGVQLVDGEKFWCNIDPLAGIQFIEEAASAAVDVQYFA